LPDRSPVVRFPIPLHDHFDLRAFAVPISSTVFLQRARQLFIPPLSSGSDALLVRLLAQPESGVLTTFLVAGSWASPKKRVGRPFLAPYAIPFALRPFVYLPECVHFFPPEPLRLVGLLNVFSDLKKSCWPSD